MSEVSVVCERESDQCRRWRRLPGVYSHGRRSTAAEGRREGWTLTLYT